MKFTARRESALPGGPKKASEVLRGMGGSEHGFDVTQILGPDDLAAVRSQYERLVIGNRLNNASTIVSALTLAYGHRPAGFETPVEVYKRYVDDHFFNPDGVLQNILIAYPEYREELHSSVKSIWHDFIQREPIRLPLKPEDFLLYKILVPAEQANLFFDPTTIRTQEEKLLRDITNGSNLSVITTKLPGLLVCDPHFKLRIPQLEDLQKRLREAIIQCRMKGSANDWSEAAILLKALVFLSADQVEISNKGELLIRHHQLRTSIQPLIPDRDLV